MHCLYSYVQYVYTICYRLCVFSTKKLQGAKNNCVLAQLGQIMDNKI